MSFGHTMRRTEKKKKWDLKRYERLRQRDQASLNEVRLPKPSALLQPIPKQVFPTVYVPPRGSIAFSLIGPVWR